MEKKSQEKIYICQPGDSNDDSSYFEEEENDEYLSFNEDVTERKTWKSSKDNKDEIGNNDGEVDEFISIEAMFEKLDIERETENVMKNFILFNEYFDKYPNIRNESQVTTYNIHFIINNYDRNFFLKIKEKLEIPEKYSYLLDKPDYERENVNYFN
jgi:hypothetical protein